MINDMFALASNWEENLCPTKCHKKDDQHVWAGSLPICQLYRTKKKSKYKGNDHLQKTHRNWSKTKKLRSPCYKTKKTNRRCVGALASTVHFMFAMENNKSIVSNPNCFINTDKNITFLWNQSLACANYGIYVATCVISHQEYIGLTINKFSNRRSAHQGTWNKSDNGDGSDQIGLSRHYSLFHGIINKHLPRPPRSGRA